MISNNCKVARVYDIGIHVAVADVAVVVPVALFVAVLSVAVDVTRFVAVLIVVRVVVPAVAEGASVSAEQSSERDQNCCRLMLTGDDGIEFVAVDQTAEIDLIFVDVALTVVDQFVAACGMGGASQEVVEFASEVEPVQMERISMTPAANVSVVLGAVAVDVVASVAVEQKPENCQTMVVAVVVVAAYESVELKVNRIEACAVEVNEFVEEMVKNDLMIEQPA